MYLVHGSLGMLARFGDRDIFFFEKKVYSKIVFVFVFVFFQKVKRMCVLVAVKMLKVCRRTETTENEK